MVVQNAFCKRLRMLREEKGLNQSQLGEALRTTRGSISFYENEERLPNVDFLNKAADFFDVSTDYLLGRSDDRQAQLIGVSDMLGLSEDAISRIERLYTPYKEVFETQKMQETKEGTSSIRRGSLTPSQQKIWDQKQIETLKMVAAIRKIAALDSLLTTDTFWELLEEIQKYWEYMLFDDDVKQEIAKSNSKALHLKEISWDEYISAKRFMIWEILNKTLDCVDS